MHGILAVDKPFGWTSHDVVARVRRLAAQRRTGHAGTLDPMATGVLVLCLGQATRLSDMLMDGTKWYLARLTFGIQTDTDDAMGTPVERAPVRFDLDMLADALESQVGPIRQVPPAFAAIKRGGVPAYKLARSGESVELEARPVTIHAIALLSCSWDGESPEDSPRTADVLICCSKGTYIRALARDVGRLVGSGAHLSGLRRLASGRISTEQCSSIDDLESDAKLNGQEAVARHLLPLDAAVSTWRAVVVGEQGARQAGSGAPIAIAGARDGELLRIYDQHGRLLALATADLGEGAGAVARPFKVFPLAGES